MEHEELARAIEAVLFVAVEPVLPSLLAELLERIEAQTLQEEVGGAIEGGLPGSVGPAHHLDVAPLLEEPGHPVDVHASQRRDLPPGHGLAVGHDGQRLQGGRRQPV